MSYHAYHAPLDERGIDEIPTVHMGVTACQMEKKGIATEKGELNRNIQKANRMIKEIRAQIGKLKEWIAGLLTARDAAPKKPQPSQSPDLVSFLQSQGEQLTRAGNEYRWKQHDSMTIRGNKWYLHSQSKGGGPVDFVMEFFGKIFTESGISERTVQNVKRNMGCSAMPLSE